MCAKTTSSLMLTVGSLATCFNTTPMGSRVDIDMLIPAQPNFLNHVCDRIVSCKLVKLISHRIISHLYYIPTCNLLLSRSLLPVPRTTPENSSWSYLHHPQIAPSIPSGSPSLIVSNSDLWICTGTPHPHSPIFARWCIFCHSWTLSTPSPCADLFIEPISLDPPSLQAFQQWNDPQDFSQQSHSLFKKVFPSTPPRRITSPLSSPHSNCSQKCLLSSSLAR